MPTLKASAVASLYLLSLISVAGGCSKSPPDQSGLVPVAPPSSASSSGAVAAPTGPSQPAPPPGQNLLQPTADLTSWKFWQSNGGQGSLSSDNGAVCATVTQGTHGYWHVQFYQVVTTLQEGKTYTLSFRAKADRPMDLPLNAATNVGEPKPIGLIAHAEVGRNWKAFTYTFTARGIAPGNNRVPTFMVGNKPVRLWIADAVLKEKA